MPTFVADELVTAAKLNAATARDWEAWAPTYANLTVGNGTVVARYIQVGKLVVARWTITFGSSSAMGTGPTVSLPVTSATSGYANDDSPLGNLIILDSGTARFDGLVLWASSTTMRLLVAATGSTYESPAGITATVPMTWATGDKASAEISYEAA